MSRLHTLECGGLQADISEKGAELKSLRLDGHEYLWNSDARYWADSALNLFPYVGRLTNGTCTLDDVPYRLDIHGFVKDSFLEVLRTAKNEMTFTLCDDERTYAQYPFRFCYRVRYRIEGATLHVSYEVENRGQSAMYFGIGGHPGFRVPLEDALQFDDYELVFSKKSAPSRILFSDSCFVVGHEPYALQEGVAIPLSHGLFDQDAIVLMEMPDSVSLQSAKGRRALRMDYPGFRYLGFWHMPHTDAPYVCIEPWMTLPSREGVVEELPRQPDMITLPQGEVYTCAYRITLFQ